MHWLFEAGNYYTPQQLLQVFTLYTIFIIGTTFLLNPKLKKIPTVLWGLIFNYLAFFPCHFNDISPYYTAFSTLFIIAWEFIFFKDKFLPKLINAFSTFFVLMIVDILSYAITVCIYGENFSKENYNIGIFLETLVFLIVYLLYMSIWLKKYKKSRIKITSYKFTFVLIVLFATAFFLIFIIERFLIWNLLTVEYQRVSLAIMYFYVLFFGLIIFLFRKSMKDNEKYIKLREEHKLLEKQNELQSKYYESLQKNIDSTRKLRHDINNIIQVIRIELAQNTKESRERSAELIDSIAEITEKARLQSYCENRLINTVIFDKTNAAAKEKIKINSSVDLDEDSGIESLDLCRVFINILDNAIEAVKGADSIEDKNISLSCREENGTIYIKTVNNVFLSKDAGSKEHHGLGLKIIEEIVQKYDGTLIAKEENSEFIVIISLKRCAQKKVEIKQNILEKN